MDIKITRPARGGTIRAIASKSQAHRLLIGAALADGPSRIGCAETSDDIDATVRCLGALGAKVKYDGGGFDILPIPRPVPGERVLDCGESGSTLRFMLPWPARWAPARRFIWAAVSPRARCPLCTRN
jgi:3-phosphoshikimate 1-carboxyvinyltransferase